MLNLSVLPTYELGVLLRDVELTQNGIKVLFTLPKGLTVENASPRGLAKVGLFEPERFTITVAASNSEFIDYSSAPKKSPYGALYTLHSIN